MTTKAEDKTNDTGRTTLFMDLELLEDVKNIAYWDRQTLKQTLEAALNGYVATWKKKNGELKPRPDEAKRKSKK